MHRKNERNFQSAKILLVDDDPRLLAALSLRLTEMGCRCTTCSNASEAMVQFAVGTYDLVMTDLTMPGMDGLSIVGMIRSQSEIPILIVTGHSAEYGPLLAGFRNVALIRKPFETRDLMALVRSFLWEKIDPNTKLKCG